MTHLKVLLLILIKVIIFIVIIVSSSIVILNNSFYLLLDRGNNHGLRKNIVLWKHRRLFLSKNLRSWNCRNRLSLLWRVPKIVLERSSLLLSLWRLIVII
jgi:hypothetical protein